MKGWMVYLVWNYDDNYSKCSLSRYKRKRDGQYVDFNCYGTRDGFEITYWKTMREAIIGSGVKPKWIDLKNLSRKQRRRFKNIIKKYSITV